ncbi:hypothetical protein E4U53_000421 [Claviceps sorghi]|nr:hypothetical protein E4U53_000421 [Claviceps sorghi]
MALLRSLSSAWMATPPRLRTRRPSPTTAEFSVTTVPRWTAPLRILVLARLLLALATLLLAHALWTTTAGHDVPASALLARYRVSPPGRLLARTARSLPPAGVVALCLAAAYVVTRRLHSTESLLVLRGLGVQTRELPAGTCLGGGGTTRFIPTEKIRDILVNEAFRGFEVRYYLVVVVEGEADLVVVFPGLLPPRSIVEAVWRGARECLYEGGVSHEG